MKRSLWIVAVFSCLVFSNLLHAANYDVDPLADNDCSDFICDLQSALTASQNNGQDDTLTLASGDYDASALSFTYQPTENKSLTLIGSGAGLTVLDGGGALPVMVMATISLASDSDADITVKQMSFRNGASSISGGGLSIATNDADIEVDHCDFQFNESTVPLSGQSAGGGGLIAFAGNFGSTKVTNNHFSHNFVTAAGGGSVSGSVRGHVLVEGNTYVENTTVDLSSPGESIGGGAVVVAVFGTFNANRNLFLRNSSFAGGGLVAVAVFGSGVITNNIMAGNSASSPLAPSPGSFAGGGGLVAVAGEGTASVDVTNNTIFQNSTVDGDGGGLLVFMSSDGTRMTLTNNIIWGNMAVNSLCSTNCNDIAVEDNADANNLGSIVDISYSNFSDISFTCNPNAGCTPHRNVDAATNLDQNPLFVDADQADFHLTEASPLINKGSSSAPSLPDNDFEGSARVQGANPDMGAFESPFDPAPSTENCANNVDDDGDGQIDCLDPDCAGAAACLGGNPPASENCANNVDDDGDGDTDCADSNCVGAVACQDDGTPPPPTPGGENCVSNVDDDGDGLIDCLDPDCAGAAACQDPQPPTTPPATSVTASGCAMTAGSGSLASILFLFAPFLLAARRARRS